jgi:hypothetical protein
MLGTSGFVKIWIEHSLCPFLLAQRIRISNSFVPAFYTTYLSIKPVIAKRIARETSPWCFGGSPLIAGYTDCLPFFTRARIQNTASPISWCYFYNFVIMRPKHTWKKSCGGMAKYNRPRPSHETGSILQQYSLLHARFAKVHHAANELVQSLETPRLWIVSWTCTPIWVSNTITRWVLYWQVHQQYTRGMPLGSSK